MHDVWILSHIRYEPDGRGCCQFYWLPSSYSLLYAVIDVLQEGNDQRSGSTEKTILYTHPSPTPGNAPALLHYPSPRPGLEAMRVTVVGDHLQCHYVGVTLTFLTISMACWTGRRGTMANIILVKKWGEGAWLKRVKLHCASPSVKESSVQDDGCHASLICWI